MSDKSKKITFSNVTKILGFATVFSGIYGVS